MYTYTLIEYVCVCFRNTDSLAQMAVIPMKEFGDVLDAEPEVTAYTIVSMCTHVVCCYGQIINSCFLLSPEDDYFHISTGPKVISSFYLRPQQSCEHMCGV